MNYTAFVDDNYHYMDKSERYEAGTYLTAEEAVEAAKQIVLRFLRSAYKPGETTKELYDQYVCFGEDPFIIGPSPLADFSAWDFAKSMCQVICEEEPTNLAPSPPTP